MKVAVVVTQRGKYIHRVVGPTGRFLGIVNAGDTARGRRPAVSWYAQHLDGHRTTDLPDLETAVRALYQDAA